MMPRCLVLIFALSFNLLGCSGGFGFLGGVSKPETVSTPVPPVPVIGSYLTGVLYDSAGVVAANAALEIPDITTGVASDASGRFQLPALGALAQSFEVRISGTRLSGELLLRTHLPEHVAALLRESDSVSQISKLMVIFVLPERESLIETSEAGVWRGQLVSHAVPAPDGRTSYSHFPHFDARRNGDVAQVRWSRFAGASGNVRIAISPDAHAVETWNGQNDGKILESGGRVLTDFAQCESSFQSTISGPLNSVDDAFCGLALNGTKQHIRIAVIGENVVCLSAVQSLSERVIFEFTGQVQSFTVSEEPSAARPLVIHAWGGGGASGAGGAAGGGSGYARLAITAGLSIGDTLEVFVGGAGQLGASARSGGGGGAGEGGGGTGGAGGGLAGLNGGPDLCGGGVGGNGAQANGVNGGGGPSNRGYGAGLSGNEGHGGAGGYDTGAAVIAAGAGAGGWGWRLGGTSGAALVDGGGGGAGYAGGGGGGAGCHGMGGGGGSSFVDSTFGEGRVSSGTNAQPGNADDPDNAGRGTANTSGRVVISYPAP